MTEQKEFRKFDAEVGKILQLMIHSLYTNKEIFLRELISNASDACDKLRYLSITDQALLENNPDLKINISFNEKNRTITISDNGIGMNKDDLIENLGTIARSGTQKFLEQLTGNNKNDIQLIGQFGVGFYSAFMVASEVTVVTRKAGETQGYMWNSNGEGEFSVSPISGNIDRGTSITLHLREGEDGFLDKFRIQHIVKTYSDHISIPVEFIDEEGKAEILNKASALWTRNKSEISDEQYQEFYKHTSHSPDKPWLIMHNKNEGTLEYTNLLFIPSMKPFDLFHPDRKCRVKLYVKRVFITEEAVNLVPAYMRFLRGVVDSEDLPLNISRETLQHNMILDKIRKSIVKKTLSELKKKIEDRDDYLGFWQNFGAVLKEGLCEGIDEHRESILEVCLFKSALTGKLITLSEYIANMPEGQEQIFYYLTEDNSSEHISQLPQLEGFVKKNIDVLLFTDHVDEFWVNVATQFKEKELKSITRSNIELDKIKSTTEADSEEAKPEMSEDEITHLTGYFKKILAPAVQDVKLSHKLVDSPVCLTVAEGAMDIRMERFLLEQKQLFSASSKILEINPGNKIISKIKDMLKATEYNGNEESEELVHILYDQACIIEGEVIKDAASFSKRLNNFLQKALEDA